MLREWKLQYNNLYILNFLKEKMAELQTQQSLEEEAKKVDFKISIGEEEVKDLLYFLSEKIPCNIRYNISFGGIVDAQNQTNEEFPLEIMGKIFSRDYLGFVVSFSSLEAPSSDSPLFNGLKFNIYHRDPNQIEFMNVLRENTKRYFTKKKPSKT